MSFARRIDGEMTLQLLALSTRIVVRMMAGSRARFDVLVNLAMTSTRPPGGGWLSMNDDEWEVLSSLIQTKLRNATEEMERRHRLDQKPLAKRRPDEGYEIKDRPLFPCCDWGATAPSETTPC